MTGIERLRVLQRNVMKRPSYAKHISHYYLDSIASQIERETLPRPLFEDGEPVQFGDEYMSIQDVHKVKGICVRADGSFEIESVGGVCYRYGEDKRLKRPEPPDTWERIEADVNKGSACRYFGVPDSEEECGKCAAQLDDYDLMSCAESMARDVLRRCKKLAGVE